MRGYHGTTGDNILSIIDSGVFIPKNNKVFLGSSPGRTFVHGVDTGRRAAFSVKVEVDVRNAQRYGRESLQGNPGATVIEGSSNLPVKVTELHVRTPDGSGGFNHRVIEGQANIIRFLRNQQ